MDEYLLGMDLSRHLEPWAHARLNMAERALLGRRLDARREAEARHLRELWELLPPDPEGLGRMFETALRGRAMAGRAAGTERGLMEMEMEHCQFLQAAMRNHANRNADLCQPHPTGSIRHCHFLISPTACLRFALRILSEPLRWQPKDCA